MPATLGLRGSGSFTANERPQNWREYILYLFPNGEAPLTALLSLLASQGTDDAQYNWWEKRLPTQRMTLSAAVAIGAVSASVSSGAKDTVSGTIIMHESTGELAKVTSDPTSDTSIDIQKGFGAVADSAWANGDAIVVIGNVNSEGAKPPTAKAYAPTKLTNYTEIFRMPLYLTRTARRTRLRWDNTGPYREAKREALSLHSIEMEKPFIFGNPIETTGANGQPERMTGGVLNFLTTNKGTTAGGSTGTDTAFNVNGTLDEDSLDSLAEKFFRFGSTEKLTLCGSTFLKAITTLGKRNGAIQMVPRDTTYGMKITEYITAFGSLMMKMHPLFNQHPVWRQNALILDTKNLKYRHLDDTMFIKNRQDNGEDASKDEFLTEAGLEVHLEETHAYIEGVTGALIA